ncbi:MAG: helix-turn-helix transcriptional regulator [Chloroflexi bacterium]|nr:helix-turn-helix transcriptional regulator [Chloroflexota bacterium]
MSSTPPLTERENEVINCLMQGLSNKQIGLALGITTRTVEFHLGKIYAKLNVTSRSEAILKLSENNRSLTVDNHSQAAGHPQAAEPWESTVDPTHDPQQNNDSVILKRRHFMGRPLRTFIYIILIVILCGVIFLLLWNFSFTRTPGTSPQGEGALPIPSPSLPPQTVQVTAAPTLSARERNTAEVLRLAEEYDQAVKKELEKGNYETGTDPQSGENIILFQGDSKDRLLQLNDELNQHLQELLHQYKALYIAEVQPTPFPTKSIETENEAYFQQLVDQYPVFFDQVLAEGPTVPVYDPATGLYDDRVIGDAYAKSEIMVDAMGALRDAPQMAKVDQAAHTAAIREALDNPDLQLTFQQISSLANAPWIGSTAVYVDEQGALYSVAIDASRLAAIEPAVRTEVPAIEVKSIEEVRSIAEEFALKNSPHYSEMRTDLQFEEGSKGDIYFYTWRMQGVDWSETSWKMMPPFLQIGLSADGKIVTYNNTLDLYEEPGK